MNIERILNIVGVLGIIASLLFVGLELRQNQVIAIAGQQQARTEARLDQLLSTYDFSYEEIGVESIPWKDQSDAQKYIREQRQIYYWVVNENNFYQYQAGLLNEEIWERESRYTVMQWNHCHLRHVFEGQEFIKSFEDYVRGLPDNCNNTTDENAGIIPRFQ
tara:strand:- start:1310 stop:1795 length:486 start_codon:yes stop_codon:yes gene_type:complete